MFPFNILQKSTTKKKVIKKTPKKEKYLIHKENTRKLITEKLEFYQNFYKEKDIHLTYNRIAIRDTKTRWGSCSSKSNLNFTYKLILLPPHLADYVIVHELCHLKEMNHAKEFWGLVSVAMPDYKNLRTELKKINLRKL